MPEQTQELLKWAWGILIIPLTWLAKLAWDFHMKQQNIQLAMETQKKDFERMLHEHQQWVSKEHPTNDYFNQRLEDMITPLQLSILQNNRDMKSQGEKIDSILILLVKESQDK